MNHTTPATQSSEMYAPATTSPPRNRLARTNPPRSACQPLIRELAIQNGAAKTMVSSGGTAKTRISSSIPSPPGSRDRVSGQGHGNGAFQPPKKRATVSADRMNTLTYSAKKKKPKRIPEYSVAKPATISESASVRSNGVRLPSAVAALKKITKPSGCWKTYQLLNQPDWLSTIWLRLIVPASRISPTTDRVSGIS